MTLAIPRTTARSFKRIGAHYFVAGALAVAIGVAAVIGAWQLSSGGDGSATVVKPAARPEPQARHVIYLVSSQEQAQAVLLAEDEAALIRSQSGDFGNYDKVEALVVMDGGSNAGLVPFVNENQFLNDLGAPEVTLIDLRKGGR